MKQFSFYTIIISNVLYSIIAFLSLYGIYLVSSNQASGFGLSVILDVIGHLLTFLFMVSCIIGSWVLFNKEKLKLALFVSSAPLILVALVAILPHFLLHKS